MSDKTILVMEYTPSLEVISPDNSSVVFLASKYAFDTDEADAVFLAVLKAAFDLSTQIKVVFDGIELGASCFLHRCVGEIYNPDYAILNLPSRITVTSDEILFNSMICNVIQEAKDYFANKELYDEVFKNEGYGYECY